MTNFNRKCFDTWNELKNYVACCHSGETWLYRGQPSHTMSLSSSLERACKTFGVCADKRQELESRLLREFRRRFHLYAETQPDERDTLGWLSLMRHHGAPTRLLDFTYSFSVAAFFAVESAEKKDFAEIWGIRSDWLEKQVKGKFKKCRDVARLIALSERETNKERYPESFDDLYLRPPNRKFVYSATPFILHDRLVIQQGTFLCPGNISVSFEHNLQALCNCGLKGNVIRMLISPDAKEDATKELHRMNMNRATLFPGLDGFAQSLTTRIPFFRDQVTP